MHFQSEGKSLVAALLVIMAGAFNASGAPPDKGSAEVVQVAAPTLSQVLPDNLGRRKATGEIKQYSPDALEGLVGPKAGIYREYRALLAASRVYGAFRVDVFQCQTRSGAFGLFSYSSGDGVATGAAESRLADAAFVGNGAVLWGGSVFVRIGPAAEQGPVNRAELSQFVTAMSGLIGSGSNPPKTPTLIESLPQEGGHPPKARYFLGPQSLSDYLPHGSDMFGFAGDAEAVLASYKERAHDAGPLKLLIVEYHTPQFAHDAMERAAALVSSLPPDDQSKIVLKRIGNYIVEANDVIDRDFADHLVDSVKYPYTVKLFQVPFHRKEDPHAGQKAAMIILSSFRIVGLALASAFMGGGIVGTIIFLRRRKQQREVFSDAGGMLRLDLEELCAGTSSGALPGATHRLPGGGSDNLG
jgi:hypothetical protein